MQMRTPHKTSHFKNQPQGKMILHSGVKYLCRVLLRLTLKGLQMGVFSCT